MGVGKRKEAGQERDQKTGWDRSNDKTQGTVPDSCVDPEAEHSRGSLVLQKTAPPDPCLCKEPLLNHKINKRVGGELLGRKGESKIEE